MDIGVDDYKERKVKIERRVPAAQDLKPTRYDAFTNEKGRLIPEVPFFKATDAVLASAVYLKYGELLVAFLQAYVFAILTCIYLNDALHAGH